jgi:pyruvate,orthophosphate dikinase
MKASEDRRTGSETNGAKTGRFVYGFSDDLGPADVLALCGGKGSGLMRMRGLGLPVPEGFVITTEACVSYIKTRQMPAGLLDEVKQPS